MWPYLQTWFPLYATALGHCDLRWGSGIHNVAGKASSMSLPLGRRARQPVVRYPGDDASHGPLPLRRALSLLYYDYIILCGLS
jgi:hypothetical protein